MDREQFTREEIADAGDELDDFHGTDAGRGAGDRAEDWKLPRP